LEKKEDAVKYAKTLMTRGTPPYESQLDVIRLHLAFTSTRYSTILTSAYRVARISQHLAFPYVSHSPRTHNGDTSASGTPYWGGRKSWFPIPSDGSLGFATVSFRSAF